MITVKELLNVLYKNKINFFTGVPDSVLNSLSKNFYNLDKSNHVIAVNEGSAVSLGIGYYLSTKKIPCIYLQISCIYFYVMIKSILISFFNKFCIINKLIRGESLF